MPLVKVWNDNIYPHSELYKGDRLTIPAGGCIEMEWEEAIQFRGQYTPMPPQDTRDEDIPKYYKMIRIDQPSEPIFKDPGHIVHATGQKAVSAEQLGLLLAEFRDANPQRAVRDDESAKDSRIASLEAQLAEIKTLIAANQATKRGPGRPPKGAA
jgi:hypothetical protein